MVDAKDMKAMLEAYRTLLEKEKQMAMHDHFLKFMSHLGITEEPALNKMEKGFGKVLKILENDNISLKDRLLKLVDSPFIYLILEHKNFVREREIRRLTLEISNFIQSVSQGATNDEQFLRSLLACSLREAAEAIQSETIKESDLSTNEAWVDALKVGMEILANNQNI